MPTFWSLSRQLKTTQLKMPSNSAKTNRFFWRKRWVVWQMQAFMRTFQADNQLGLIKFIDLTTLSATDTRDKVRKLVDRAYTPLTNDVANGSYFVNGRKVNRHNRVQIREGDARQCACIRRVCAMWANGWTNILPPRSYTSLPVRPVFIRDRTHFSRFSVAGGFPTGMFRLESRLLEIRLAIEDGADEIDTVINRPAALDGHWTGWPNYINGVTKNFKFFSNSQKSSLNYDKCAKHAVNTCIWKRFWPLASWKHTRTSTRPACAPCWQVWIDKFFIFKNKSFFRQWLHQNQHRQGNRQCYTRIYVRDVCGNQALLWEDENTGIFLICTNNEKQIAHFSGRIQAGRWHQYAGTGAGVLFDGETGARRGLVDARLVPYRGKFTVRQHPNGVGIPMSILRPHMFSSHVISANTHTPHIFGIE